jgi:predicted RNA binding protein YcfA (HicA-like mRNA interferase family)
MKITTFDPIIVSPKAADVVKLFEELGFEKTHSPVTAVETGEVHTFRMKHENGYHVDVSDMSRSLPDLKSDYIVIRMNVDDFDEAYKILTAHGFKNTRGDGKLETGSADVTTMVSPSGFTIALVKHIKKDSE